MINSLKEIRMFDKRTFFYDHKNSFSVYAIGNELKEEYKLDQLKINDGDVIVDIGAHVGVVTTFLSKVNSNAKIFSFEPSNNTFNCLKKNLEMNQVGNATIFNVAITSDGRDVTMNMPIYNTGGSSLIYGPPQGTYYINTVKSIAINDLVSSVLRETGADKIKLLKIDCEAAEYEILNTLNPELFSKIEFLIGEFHTINGEVEKTPQNLMDLCTKYIDPKNIQVRFL